MYILDFLSDTTCFVLRKNKWQWPRNTYNWKLTRSANQFHHSGTGTWSCLNSGCLDIHKSRSCIDHSGRGVFIDYRSELRAGVAARPNSRHGSKRITDCKLVRFVYRLFAISYYMPARAEVRWGVKKGKGCKGGGRDGKSNSRLH